MMGKISENIDELYEQLGDIFSNCFDIVRRELTDVDGRRAILVFSDGLVNKDTIQDNVIRPLLGFSFDVAEKRVANIADMRLRLLSPVDVKSEHSLRQAVQMVLYGDTALFIEGASECLVVQTRGWQSRGISKPDTQQSVRGPKEGFTETLLFNAAMLRRKIRDPRLKLEILRCGNVSHTDICLAYVEGVAEKKLVDEVRRRIESVDVNYILESGHIEQLIEDQHRTVFATIANNEKPDIVAGKLMKGRVAVIVDGTPFVLTAPMVFTENFQAVEDYYSRPFYANFLRLLRLLAYFVTLTLPALYIALVSYHREMIPEQLLQTLISANEGVPMPPVLEMFIMLLLYELLREALLRLPTQIGSTVGIVGVLIIGDAAVGVSLLGAPTVVIAAMTFITSAVVNSAADSTAVIRMILLILAAAFGVFGVYIGIFLVLAHLCTLTSLGYPYMLPVAPVRPQGLKDSIVRGNIRNILKRGGING